jgi:hypothetical protein
MSEAVVPRVGTAKAETATPPTPPPSFPDLVWAHYDWDSERREGRAVDPQKEEAYRTKLEEFEQAHGKLVSVYWSRVDASAVAVTVKPRGPQAFGDTEVCFRRATDWATRSTPLIPDVLNQCETLAMKAREVLRGTSERIAIQWVFGVASHLLGFLERHEGKASRSDIVKAAADGRRELLKVEEYYDRAGTKAGRIVYSQGMMLGVLAMVGVGFLSAGILWLFGAYDANSEAIQFFFACYGAGALGGIVSVMSRMASPRNTFVVDYEVGRPALRLLGSFRPLLGAIFGLALYFAVKAGLLQISPGDEKTSLYWYTVLSFLAGFSERFTQVILGGAERTIAASVAGRPRRDEDEDEPELPPETTSARDEREGRATAAA